MRTNIGTKGKILFEIFLFFVCYKFSFFFLKKEKTYTTPPPYGAVVQAPLFQVKSGVTNQWQLAPLYHPKAAYDERGFVGGLALQEASEEEDSIGEEIQNGN